jgi:sugar lactone lactonase YvrE
MRRTYSSAISSIAILIFLMPAARAQQQHTITTVAGGAPNNVSALKVGISYPTAVFKDSAGNLYVASGSLGNAVYRIDPSGLLTTVAGMGTEGFSGDGGPATTAELNFPEGLFVDGAGNIFIADSLNDRIREVVAATGNIQTVAGNGSSGFSGDGGPATAAALNEPQGVFVDASGNIFIAETDRIREVVAATGNIRTVAGGVTAGFSGDGGPATSAALDGPTSVYVDRSGNIFIADMWNNRIREVVAATGNIQTVAGSGPYGFDPNFGVPVCAGYTGDGGAATSAHLCQPTGVYVDGAGSIFIADSTNNAIREVVSASGNIQTVVTGFDPHGVHGDGSGNIFFSSPLSNTVSAANITSRVTQAVAGNGTCCFGGDGGPATDAELNLFLGGVSVDRSGNILIADTSNNRIRKVDAATGTIQTVAGSGVDSSCLGCFALSGGFSGDGDAAKDAQLNSPGDVSADRSGNVFIADSSNHRIREVDAASGHIQTVAGNGTAVFSGDGGPATSAGLGGPIGVFADNSGNVFTADSGRILEVVATTGIIQSPFVAGPHANGFSCDPAAGGLVSPSDVFVDSSGNIFFADTLNACIHEIIATTGEILTIAGTGSQGFTGDGGPATGAQLFPTSVYVDSLGNAFIADTFNNRVREVNAVTGIIQTVAGNGTEGSSGDGGPATSAELSGPIDVVGDHQGNLLIAERDGRRIRRVAGIVPVVGIAAAPAMVTVSPGATRQFTANVTNAINTAIAWSLSGTRCSGNTCGTISPQGLYTAPPPTGIPQIVTVTASSVADDTKSATATVTVPAKRASFVAMSSSPGSPVLGQPVILTATVTPSSGSGLPTGTVTFQDGTTTLGTASLNSSGTATFTTSSLAVAAHQITATYNGDSGFFASNANLTENVSYCIRPLHYWTRSLNRGITSPIELYLCDASGNDVSSSAIVLHATQMTGPSGFSNAPPGSAEVVNLGSDFRFEAWMGPRGGYIYTLETAGLAPGTYTLQFTAGSDPITHSVSFAVSPVIRLLGSPLGR